MSKWIYHRPWTWSPNDCIHPPMTFLRYVEEYGYDSLWDYDNIIPDDTKQTILDNFISRRIGFESVTAFQRAFRMQIQLYQDRYMKLLQTEYVAFDPLVENYSFEEFQSENEVDRKNQLTTTGRTESTGFSRTDHNTTVTNENRRTDDITQDTIHGRQDTLRINGTVNVEVEGENNTDGKARTINSGYPESNVTGATGEVLGDINWRYASNASDSADKRKDTNEGKTTSTTNGTNTTNTTGTDTVNNTGTVTNHGTSATTGDDSTNTNGSNESNATNLERGSTIGKNRNTREQKGRNQLPQSALTSYRTFVRGSEATQWLLRQLDIVFYGLMEV